MEKARGQFLDDGARFLAEAISQFVPTCASVVDIGGNAAAVADHVRTSDNGPRLALALGVAEFIAAEQADALIDDLCNRADNIIFAATAPGQAGEGLLNCQWPSFWVKAFAARGFSATDNLRRLIWDDERFPIWCRQNLLLFTRGAVQEEISPSQFDIVHPHTLRQAETRSEVLTRDNERLLAMWTNRYENGFSPQEVHWCRIVMNEETKRLMKTLDYSNMSCLEISGCAWQGFGFKDYTVAVFPQFDITKHVARRADGQGFDVIIAEQVLEHVPVPWVGVSTMYQGLAPGGHLLVTTPFFIRIHAHPHDYTRWTEAGLRNLFEYAGFAPDKIITGSWGNRACVNANFVGSVYRAEAYDQAVHSLENEPDVPIMVWAFAQK
ncbi:methyltransferase domain-containing protein [Niveispirillum sp. BGYR6]|uniref:class I SAM-dependent methyltransferase n=1 Tax=Niveispirillum sp. BGYR6 TaxID=2971249 RepID=UPI0022B9B8CD|nr:methyltransferase domain-containing protein [Niveispirillum sp. BGYR6]MDG5496776.1 methyltransferase domain-containing protein [Niveispirillum sp. BGYR6]